MRGTPTPAADDRGAASQQQPATLIRRGNTLEINLDAIQKPLADSPEVVMLINVILVDSLKRRATGIHIGLDRDTCAVRYRIKGVLRPVFALPPRFWEPLAGRIRSMSRLGSAATATRLDGGMRVKATIEDQVREFAFEVSYLPSPRGGGIILQQLALREGRSRPTRR
jgi:type IV pilus assembly protein PilB